MHKTVKNRSKFLIPSLKRTARAAADQIFVSDWMAMNRIFPFVRMVRISMMIKAIVSFFGHFSLFLQILIHMLEIEQKMCYNKLILLSHSNAPPRSVVYIGKFRQIRKNPVDLRFFSLCCQKLRVPFPRFFAYNVTRENIAEKRGV